MVSHFHLLDCSKGYRLFSPIYCRFCKKKPQSEVIKYSADGKQIPTIQLNEVKTKSGSNLDEPSKDSDIEQLKQEIANLQKMADIESLKSEIANLKLLASK